MTIEQLVVHAFQEFANGNLEPLRPLLHENFVEHNPDNPSGRDAFIESIGRAPVATAQLDLQHVIADDTHVVLHYLMTTPDSTRAVADIWRFENNQIVEHWDVVQPL
ncbi:nuclear transport factor 2 family protein [Kribbella sp. HUAS MG21]|uniref:Nuclear transport factor 2 family protein n=1 Tax=Kribbella sp. HUAS MG21 TaxID=3160966 RepID=A0AAU7TF91_9ACTN